MAFVPEPEFPDLTQLLTSLNNSQISIKNPALYQTIKGLIQKVQQLKGLAQEDIESINLQLTNLADTINNLTLGTTVILPPPWMPVFDGEDGDDGFPIVGPQGPRGEDGKSIPNFCEHECIEPPPLLPQCCVGEIAEFSTSTTGTINDLDFANANLIRFTGASAITVTGIKAGRAGQIVTIVNTGGSTVRIADQDGGSTGSNQFLCPSVRGQIIGDTGAIVLSYDGTSAKWRPVAVNPGDPITPAFNAGDFTSSGGETWTVASGDVITFAYQQRGKVIDFWWFINTTTVVTGGLSPNLIITLPNSFVSTKSTLCLGYGQDNGVRTFTFGFTTAGNTTITNQRGDAANWALSVDNTYLYGQAFLEVN